MPLDQRWNDRGNSRWKSLLTGRVYPYAPQFVAFAAGTVKPIGRYDDGIRNVGCRLPVEALTVQAGDFATTADNQVVSGLHIQGRLRIGHNGVTVRDCIIDGAVGATSEVGVVEGRYSLDAKGALLEWVTIDAVGHWGPWQHGLNGSGYTIRYSEIYGGVDGLHINTGAAVTLECCRVAHGYLMSFWNDSSNAIRTTGFTDYGGTAWTPPFGANSDGTPHADAVQIAGGGAGTRTLRGNYFGGPVPSGALSGGAQIGALDPTVAADYAIIQLWQASLAYKNSAVIVNGTATAMTALIEKNWLGGGAARLNLSTNAGDSLSGVTVRDNRFVRGPGYAIYAQAGNAATYSGNVYDDDGSPVSVVTW